MLKNYLNKIVKVKIDRPINTKHPTCDIIYSINYGYLPNTISGDGKEIDAYILGVDKPLKEFKGKVIAVIHRLNDIEDKLVVAPINKNYNKQEILNQVNFQERYFNIQIIL